MVLVHTQYNDPIKLYSNTSATEALQMATGHTPQGGPKEFDPSRSSVLAMLREDEPSRGSAPTRGSEGPPSRVPSAMSYGQVDIKGYVDPNVQSPSFNRITHGVGADGMPVSGGTTGYRSVQQSSVSHTQQEGHGMDPHLAAKIAEAERPRVPTDRQPSWTGVADAKQQKWSSSTTSNMVEVSVDDKYKNVFDTAEAKFYQGPTKQESDMDHLLSKMSQQDAGWKGKLDEHRSGSAANFQSISQTQRSGSGMGSATPMGYVNTQPVRPAPVGGTGGFRQGGASGFTENRVSNSYNFDRSSSLGPHGNISGAQYDRSYNVAPVSVHHVHYRKDEWNKPYIAPPLRGGSKSPDNSHKKREREAARLEAQRRAEEERRRHQAEAAERLRHQQEEDRRRAELEAERRRQQEAENERMRQMQADEERRRREAESEARGREEAERRRMDEERRWREEEEHRLRIEEEHRRTEQIRIEEERRRTESIRIEEERRRSEQMRIDEERRRSEEDRRREDEERRRQEQIRIDEERRRQEQIRIEERRRLETSRVEVSSHTDRRGYDDAERQKRIMEEELRLKAIEDKNKKSGETRSIEGSDGQSKTMIMHTEGDGSVVPYWQNADGSMTKATTSGTYDDAEGHKVHYTKEVYTSSDPGKEFSMLTEEEKKVMEQPLQPGVISRHVTTKYYKKSTFTSSTTTGTTGSAPISSSARITGGGTVKAIKSSSGHSF